jgi:hypothetical protein
MTRMTGKETWMTQKGDSDLTRMTLRGFDLIASSIVRGFTPGLDRAYTEPCAALWMTRSQSWTVLVLHCA